MSQKIYGLDGIGSNVEFGQYGLRIKSTGTVFEARTNDEGDLVILRAADGVDATDVVTKGQLDTKQDTLSIAAGSQNYLDLTGGELSVKNLLVHDVVVDNSSADLAAFIAASYTLGTEFQEGDIIVLSVSTDSQQRTWIHNGGTDGIATDFTRLQVDLSDTVIRAMFSAGTGISYNSSTGVISCDVEASEVTASDTGYTYLTGSDVQALFGSVDTYLGTLTGVVDDLVTLSGVASGSTDLGTGFAYIDDNSTIKDALVDLETAIAGIPSSDTCRMLSFDHTSASEVNIEDVIPSGKIITRIKVKCTTAFNDMAAFASIGTDADNDIFMTSGEINLRAATLSVAERIDVLGANTQVKLFLSKGTSTAGAGMILVDFC